MVTKVSLALALLLYFLQGLSGMALERNLYLSILYFLVFYTLLSIYHTIYLHIRLRLLRLEQAEREAQKRREREEKETRAAEALVSLFKEPSTN